MRVLLVDDEKPARSRMRRLLEAEGGFEILGEATQGLEALQKIDELKPDLVFLDIEMPELGGLEVARSLGAEGPAVVFVTAYDEFALKAFETHAIDYLVKPVTPSRLQLTLNKLRVQKPSPAHLSPVFSELLRQDSLKRLAVKSGNRYIVVSFEKVSAILAKDHYSAIQADGKELLADEPLEYFEQKLDPEKFLRVHRSGLVNLEYVRELEREGDRKYVLILKDTACTRVPVARERLESVRLRLGM